MHRTRSILALLLAVTLTVPASMAHAAGPNMARSAIAATKAGSSVGVLHRVGQKLGLVRTTSARTRTNAFGEKPPTFGERVADKVARFAGSWKFLFLLSAGTTTWMAAHNVLGDPQLIKLNLGISIVTMLTGPLVLMSQNRSGERDRLRGEKDLQVNIKAEKEISELHAKMDRMGEQIERMAAAVPAQNAAEPVKKAN